MLTVMLSALVVWLHCCVGAFGPVKTASATSGPVTSAALQQHHKVPMGYLPVQLLGLLKTLRRHLDMAVAEITIHAHDTVSQDFVLQSHKVSSCRSGLPAM